MFSIQFNQHFLRVNFMTVLDIEFIRNRPYFLPSKNLQFSYTHVDILYADCSAWYIADHSIMSDESMNESLSE